MLEFIYITGIKNMVYTIIEEYLCQLRISISNNGFESQKHSSGSAFKVANLSIQKTLLSDLGEVVF
jgi:hypothetical protein